MEGVVYDHHGSVLRRGLIKCKTTLDRLLITAQISIHCLSEEGVRLSTSWIVAMVTKAVDGSLGSFRRSPAYKPDAYNLR